MPIAIIENCFKIGREGQERYFGQIKTDLLKKVKWSTDGMCDHVNFCKEIQPYGSIYLDPKNKVYAKVDQSIVHMLSLQAIVKSQLQKNS